VCRESSWEEKLGSPGATADDVGVKREITEAKTASKAIFHNRIVDRAGRDAGLGRRRRRNSSNDQESKAGPKRGKTKDKNRSCVS